VRHLYTVKVNVLLIILVGLHENSNDPSQVKLPVNAVSELNVTVHVFTDEIKNTSICAPEGVYPVTSPDKGVTATSEITVAYCAE
jgi:hypothetical protein